MSAIERRPRSDLREQQRFITKTMLRSKAKLIVSAMGSGKTGAALTAGRELLDSMEVQHILVIAPLRVATDTWPNEVQSWEHTNCLSVAVCTGTMTEKARLAALKRRAEITVTNLENLQWLWKALDNGAGWFFDCIIIDESSAFKAGEVRTKRTKVKRADGTKRIRKGGNLTRFGVLAMARKRVRRIYLLTGTPSPNGLIDLWGQIYLLDLGERLGSDKESFLRRWFDENRYDRTIKPRAHAEKEIMALISDVMVSLPPLDLVSPPVYVPVPVDLPADAMKEYRRFERNLVSEVYDVEAVNSGVLTNKLLQFANGSMYREDRSIAEVHEAKLDALDELIEQAGGDNVLILYGFQFDINKIRERHPDVVLLNDGDDVLERWNAGKIKVLAAHPKSCAHGLNMQYGGHIQIWYGLTWSLELWQQANARLARPGQKRQVAIYMIMARGTCDEDVMAVLKRKDATQEAVTEAVRARILRDDPAPVSALPEEST